MIKDELLKIFLRGVHEGVNKFDLCDQCIVNIMVTLGDFFGIDDTLLEEHFDDIEDAALVDGDVAGSG